MCEREREDDNTIVLRMSSSLIIDRAHFKWQEIVKIFCYQTSMKLIYLGGQRQSFIRKSKFRF